MRIRCVLIAICCSLQAIYAQAQDNGTPSNSPKTQPAKAASLRLTLEEVLVTARRRSENIQETPIAVTAISGEALREQGIVNTKDLSKSVPSLQINKGHANQIYIRGIGERTGFARVDPTVGVYLDDLFLPRTDGQLLDTVDIDSIQVLRGPQGTLFGKNTTGGALVLTLTKPNEEFAGYVDAGLGNYGLMHVKAGVNMPVTDNFYMRGAVSVIEDDGFMKDRSTGDRSAVNNRQSLLLQSRWDINSSNTLDSLFFYGKIRDTLPGINCDLVSRNGLFTTGLYVMWPGDKNPSQPQAYRENCESNSRERLGDLQYNQGPNPNLDKELDTFMLGATWRWEISESMNLKFVFGARDAKEGPIQSSDNDGGPANWSEALNPDDGVRDSASLELQLNGFALDDRISYATGLFYMEENNFEPFLLVSGIAGLDGTVLESLIRGEIPERPPENGTAPFVGVLSGPMVLSEFDLHNATFAWYGQASWDITMHLQLTAGLRFTSETRESDLKVTTADLDEVASRIMATDPRFGPSAGGFHPFAGPWSEDPVSIAASAFTDQNGDGVNDFPLDHNNPQFYEKGRTFREWTPMLSVSYVFDEEMLADSFLDAAMVYATWSNGFKSGFFEPRLADGLQPVEPEEVVNTEIGFKLDAFERTLRLNLAFYTMDFSNMQLIQVSTDSDNNIAVVFQNAGESIIEGGEMELSWLPFQGALISLNYSNNNYKFVEYFDGAILPGVVGQTVIDDRSDENFPASPEESASLGLQFAFPIESGVLIPRLDISYKSENFIGLDRGSWLLYEQQGSDAGAVDDYVLYDFRLTWQNPDGDRSVVGYIRNLTDERYLVGTAAVADSVSTFAQAYGEPRQYGVEFRQTF